MPKRGPSSPKIIVDTNLTVQNSSAIRPTPVKAGKSITHLDNNKQVQVVQQNSGERGHSLSPQNYAIKAKVINAAADEVPERDTNGAENIKEPNLETSSASGGGGQLVTNVVIGEDSGFQILSSKDEEAEREKPRKVISTKVHKKKIKAIHDHRKDDLSQSLEKAKKLLDVKAAIEKLRLRSIESEDGTGSEISTTSSETSNSSESDSEVAIAPVTAPKGGDHSKPSKTSNKPSGPTQQPHHPQVTSSADEFVWIDSYNRLVELQKLPWTHTDLCKAICQRTSMQESEVIGADLLSRLSYYLQRALVRISREAQRLAKSIGKCGKQEISSALKIVLSPALATLSVKACLRAAAMFTISNEDTRQTKSSRAGLLLHVGKMHRWMTLVKVGKFVHEMAAIYLSAGIETIMEDLISKCLEASGGNSSRICSSILETTVSSNSDYWGLFQPYSHLSSCRTTNGLDMPRALLDYAKEARGHPASQANGKTLGQVLLTTCVGSVEELEEMVSMIGPVLRKTWQSVGASANATSSASLNTGGSIRSNSQASGIFGMKPNLLWNTESLRTLYHFVRCSQLEYVGQDGRLPIQELIYERPYMVLPPMVEWARVATAFAEHRNSTHVDSDDVMQAARILLPGMDCPVRPLENPPLSLSTSMSAMLDELEYVNHVKKEMALHMLQTGRRDLVPHALQMLPNTDKVNTTNNAGLTPLQMAALRGDTNVVRLLLDTGAYVDGRSLIGENKNWTSINYAVTNGHYRTAKLLLDRGAHVEGGALLGDNHPTETPLQLAAASGSVRMVELLLASGASAFRSTTESQNGFSSAANYGGCYSAVAVAATHGHKKVLNLLVSHALTSSPEVSSAGNGTDQVLSLEEILSEGAIGGQNGSADDKASTTRLVKSQVKKLQEAMYHASEATNLELTLDLRNLGVPWTMHTWMQSLTTANETGLVSVINELLQDFSSTWPEEHSSYFIDVGLPLLFNILKTCKTEGTVLLLADIICACYGRDPIEIIDPPKVGELGQPRIDPKFINNPELSDVSFRVEGRLFYAHKLVLVTSSSRFQSMLNSRFCEGNPPVLQINDIRYDIFQLVMTYLYQGGSHSLHVEASDVLELMAAANFFQLPGLLRYCEHRCSKLVDLDNIVSYYIHAKVYTAVHLLGYCEGFLMQNMVALLTYDDSVKRLLFGKKLQNHDVVSGLLATLQVRLRKRCK